MWSWGAVVNDFESKRREEVIVIRRRQEMKGERRKKRGSKKVKMPYIELDLEAIWEIKKRKKGSRKKEAN